MPKEECHVHKKRMNAAEKTNLVYGVKMLDMPHSCALAFNVEGKLGVDVRT